MAMRRALLHTDVIVLVEILENKGTTTHRDKGKGSLKEAIVYTNDIKARVIRTHVGEFAHVEYETKYSLTLVNGAWLSILGSGLERRMVPGKKYVLMLRNLHGVHELCRAEKAERLEEVLRLKRNWMKKTGVWLRHRPRYRMASITTRLRRRREGSVCRTAAGYESVSGVVSTLFARNCTHGTT